MELAEKIKMYETVRGIRCAGCGNNWFFKKVACLECTTCGRQVIQTVIEELPKQNEATAEGSAREDKK